MYKSFIKKIASTSLLVILSVAISNAADFTLSSKDISEGKQLTQKHVFKGFGCAGQNMSPQLSWTNAPEGTKSFVVTTYDPDAPTGSGWWHWVAFNIPAKTTELTTDASAKKLMPTGTVESRTDFGIKSFGGACPPPGSVHRYIFTVYALDVEKLDLDADASPALVGFMTKAHALASAKITAVFNR